MKTVLITGSRGFVGSALADHLRSRGYRVKDCLVRLNHFNSLEQIFDSAGPDIVVHLAAKVDKIRAGHEQDDFFEVNVMGTLNVIRLCLKHKAKLIYFSSALVRHSRNKYGNKYGISKALAEDLVWSFTKNQGLKAITIRPCTIYKNVGGANINRFWKEEDISKGEWYSLERICVLVEKIIRNEDFEKYKIYKTRSITHYFNFLKTIPKRILSYLK